MFFERLRKGGFRWRVVALNVGSNLIGFFMVQLLLRFAQPIEEWRRFSELDRVTNFVLLSFLLPVSIIFLLKLSQPVDEVLALEHSGAKIDPARMYAARCRAINIPYYAGLMNLFAWLAPSIAFPVVLSFKESISLSNMLIYVMFDFSKGLMISLLALVILEHSIRGDIIPRLFPKGGLRDSCRAVVLETRHRLMIMYVATCLLPIFQITMMISANASFAGSGVAAEQILRNVRVFSVILTGFVAVYGFWLALLFAKTISEPTKRIIEVTEKVRSGDYTGQVSVVSNDEIGYLGDRVNEMVKGLREREKLRESFNLCTSPEIASEIMAAESRTGGELRTVTILFSDLRGFTPMAEKNSPQSVVESINEYFDEMTTAIIENGGVVLQYVGDEIEAVFGAPNDEPEHGDKAVKAALAMRARLNALNIRREGRGQQPLKHGIGAHTGPVLAGIIGSKHKISYAMVGDTVNVASRIQDLNKEMGSDILISETTYKELKIPHKFSEPRRVFLKGKQNELSVYQLIS